MVIRYIYSESNITSSRQGKEFSNVLQKYPKILDTHAALKI